LCQLLDFWRDLLVTPLCWSIFFYLPVHFSLGKGNRWVSTLSLPLSPDSSRSGGDLLNRIAFIRRCFAFFLLFPIWVEVETGRFAVFVTAAPY